MLITAIELLMIIKIKLYVVHVRIISKPWRRFVANMQKSNALVLSITNVVLNLCLLFRKIHFVSKTYSSNYEVYVYVVYLQLLISKPVPFSVMLCIKYQMRILKLFFLTINVHVWIWQILTIIFNYYLQSSKDFIL